MLCRERGELLSIIKTGSLIPEPGLSMQVKLTLYWHLIQTIMIRKNMKGFCISVLTECIENRLHKRHLEEEK